MRNLIRPNEVPSPRSYWSRVLFVRECKDFIELQNKRLQALIIGQTKMNEQRPHFFGLGAQKAGTSWLHTQLRQHPQLFIPPDKEAIHYFNRNFHLPLSWYLLHFSHAIDKIRGEITADYGIIPTQRINLIHSFWPDMKLLLIMRDPISRAWSHARMTFSNQGKDLSEISEEEWKAHFSGLYSTTKGNYLSIIDNWLTYYPAQQLKVIFNEDMANSPDETLADVFRFLGVDETITSNIPNNRIRINTGQELEMPAGCEGYLKEMYHDMIIELARRYGSYAADWQKQYYS